MTDEVIYIGSKIIENKNELSNKLSKIPDIKNKLDNGNLSKVEMKSLSADLIQYLGEALFEDSGGVSKKIENWAEYTGKMVLEKGISLTLALRSLAFYRTVIWDLFTKELKQKQFSGNTVLDTSKKLDPFLEKINYIFGQIYEEHNKQMMNLAQNALKGLSVPIVPIANGIAIIPIVGQIDTRRSRLIMEVSLEQGTILQLDTLILDISSVPNINTPVAEHLFQIVNALRLIDVKTIITGIRPEIAQTIVSSGLKNQTLITRSRVDQALKEIGFNRTIVTGN